MDQDCYFPDYVRLQRLQILSARKSEPYAAGSSHPPRQFAFALVGLGLQSLLLAIIEHRHDVSARAVQPFARAPIACDAARNTYFDFWRPYPDRHGFVAIELNNLLCFYKSQTRAPVQTLGNTHIAMSYFACNPGFRCST